MSKQAISNGETGLSVRTKLNSNFDELYSDKENISNKSISMVTDAESTAKYPSVKVVKDYVDGLVVNLLDLRGSYDASVNTFPATGGSGTAGAILKGDLWIISVAGTLGGATVEIGDSIFANIDAPGQLLPSWSMLNTNIAYTPENVANKVTSISAGSTDVQYPSAKLVFDQLALKGTVTVVSVVTANGVSGSVATDTTTPAITITLGAITPSSVNGLVLSRGLASVSSNIAIGNYTLASNTSGNNNIAIGEYALNKETTGSLNVALGVQALYKLTGGQYNLAIGNNSQYKNLTGTRNISYGDSALYDNASGSYNVAIGSYTLNYALGSGNVGLGYCAGRYETGSDTFYVDNQNRTNTAGDKAGALFYGTFNANPELQTLVINAPDLSVRRGSVNQMITSLVTLSSAPTSTTAGKKGQIGYYDGYAYLWIDTAVVISWAVATSF